MSLPPTLIIDDRREDRTEVDARPRRSRHRVRFARALHPSLGSVGTGIALMLAVGSSVVVHRQWRVVENLRKDVAALEAPLAEARLPRAARSPEPANRWAREAPTSTPELGIEQRGLLEQRGADLLAANDFDGALGEYRELAALFPREACFRDVVAVLRAKLQCGSKCP